MFAILRDVHGPLAVELLTAKPPADIALEAARFRQQHPQVHIETRRSQDCHDRFIVSDDTAFHEPPR